MSIKELLQQQETDENNAAQRKLEIAADTRRQQLETKSQKQQEKEQLIQRLIQDLHQVDQLIEQTGIRTILQDAAEFKHGTVKTEFILIDYADSPKNWNEEIKRFRDDDSYSLADAVSVFKLEWRRKVDDVADSLVYRLIDKLTGTINPNAAWIKTYIRLDGITVKNDDGLKLIPFPQAFDRTTLEIGVANAIQNPIHWKPSSRTTSLPTP